MSKNFLSINTNFTDFSTLPSKEVCSFLLQNDSNNLSKIYSFLQKSDKLLLVTGFFGTGKNELIKHLFSYVDKDVCKLKFSCFEAINIDDLLLYIWFQLIEEASFTNIIYKYHHIKSLRERIIQCISESPVNIILHLSDYNLISDNNTDEITGFLYELANQDKIKIIITSKTFDTTKIPEHISYSKIILKALSRVTFENFLREEQILTTTRIYDELYRVTRGYYFYTLITSIILKKKSLSINDYLYAYANSGMTFDKFLAKAYISMLPKNYKNVMSFFSNFRHPLTTEIFDYFECFDKNILDDLIKNKIINYSNNQYILNPYFKDSIIEEFHIQTEDFYKKILDFYNSQLPLKPRERAILLSRITMRAELSLYQTSAQNNIVSEISQAVEETIPSKTNDELLQIAEQFLEKYDYSSAINTYQEILSKNYNNPNEIYEKLAKIYYNLGNYKYSVYYYNLVLKAYKESNDRKNIVKIKLEISKLNYHTYKTNEAINLLHEIMEETDDNIIKIEIYTLLGNIYISKSNKNKAYDYYKEAISLSEHQENAEIFSELYFKFALLSEEYSEEDVAIYYYKKCIEISNDKSKYKALAYSNLADYYLDFKERDLAYQNYEKAYILNNQLQNQYGIYYTATNLANLTTIDKPEYISKYLYEAKNAAIKTEDMFSMANAGLHLGDFYASRNEHKKALDEYFSVIKLTENRFNEDNKKKINARIEDIKRKIGEDAFNELSKN